MYVLKQHHSISSSNINMKLKSFNNSFKYSNYIFWNIFIFIHLVFGCILNITTGIPTSSSPQTIQQQQQLRKHYINITYIEHTLNNSSNDYIVSIDLIGKNNNNSTAEIYLSNNNNGSSMNNNNNNNNLQYNKISELKISEIHGIRVEEVSKGVGYENNDVTIILADSDATLRVFGDGFTKNTLIRFVTGNGWRGMPCDDLSSTKSFQLSGDGLTRYTGTTKIKLPRLDDDNSYYYICVKENNTNMSWIHQGSDEWLKLKSYESLLPLWSQIIFIIVLLILSGLFSGLNLGLMSLDRTEMKIIAATGTENERRYAKSIQPLRDNGNYLLCTLLLGNVMVNSTLTILLDGLSSGLIAVISSTLAIVIFGEIIPQAICSRHGLAVGAKTVWLTKFFMAITFPLSYPISVLLNKILGEEIGSVYNRDRLKELIRVTRDYNDLERDEVNIIAGALELKQKTVKDVMTPLDAVFMLPTQAVLDFDTVSEIMVQGYSRIPVYEESRSNIVSLLYTKDLAFVDPDNEMPVKTICEFYHNPCMYVFESITLDIVFRDFKQGNQGHMALVQRIHTNDDNGTDPYYEIIGILTLEDVIEELIQAEINDETDVWENPRRRRSRTTLSFPNTNTTQHRTQQWKGDGIHVSPQLVLAAFQYLSTSVEQFSSERISKTILQRLLNQNFFYQIKIKNRDNIKNDPSTIIYEKGKPADYFVLILEGRVQSEIGKEQLMFESGPFTFFGIQSLNQNAGLGEAPSTPIESMKFGSNSAANLDALLYSTFVPDYTVRASTDIIYLRISRSVFMAAKQASILEKTYSQNDSSAQNQVGDHFEEQIDKMMNSKNIQRSKSDAERNQNYFQGRENSYNVPNNPYAERRVSEIILTPSHIIHGGYDKNNITANNKVKNFKTRRSGNTNMGFIPTNNNNDIPPVVRHVRSDSESSTQNEIVDGLSNNRGEMFKISPFTTDSEITDHDPNPTNSKS